MDGLRNGQQRHEEGVMLRRRESAFTTTELMVAVVIIGILAAFTAPNLGRWLSTIRVNSAARAIASELQFARMRAISQNAKFRITFDSANNTYQTEKEGEDRNNNGILDSGEDLNSNGLLDQQGVWRNIGEVF